MIPMIEAGWKMLEQLGLVAAGVAAVLNIAVAALPNWIMYRISENDRWDFYVLPDPIRKCCLFQFHRNIF